MESGNQHWLEVREHHSHYVLRSDVSIALAVGMDGIHGGRDLTFSGRCGPTAIAVGDLYSLKGALPARFIPNATFAAHPNRWDSVYRLTPSGSTTEPQALPTREGPLLGRPKIEWSTMATAATTGTKWMIYGNFREGFTIADRLGPHRRARPAPVCATNRFPTGQRVLFAYWWTGSKVVVPEACATGRCSRWRAAPPPSCWSPPRRSRPRSAATR